MARPLPPTPDLPSGTPGARPPAPADLRRRGPNRFRFRLAAHVIAGAVALVLATGLATAGTTLALNATPLPLVNTAAFVFLVAASVVSGAIVFTFWRHLLTGLAPPEARPVRVHTSRPRQSRAQRSSSPAPRQRPARPLRNFDPEPRQYYIGQHRSGQNGSIPQ